MNETNHLITPRHSDTEPAASAPSEPPPASRLGLSVRLDLPFHELKQYLVEEFERAYLTRCLEESAMNLSLASRSSGLSRRHIRTLMAKHGMARRGTTSDDGDNHEGT